MKVAELIAALQSMPSDAFVSLLWDGDLRTDAEVVWLGRNGTVGIGPWDDHVYTTGYRPEGFPDCKAVPYIKAGEMTTFSRPEYDGD